MEDVMSFRITGLPAADFSHLFSLNESELANLGAVRRTADGAYPSASASPTRSRVTN
jgi:hypothetical protein